MADSAEIIQLSRETLDAYGEHVDAAKVEWLRTLEPEGEFLWCRGSKQRASVVLKGETAAEMWSGTHPIHVPGGLIHDWIGATRIPGATVGETLALIQSYDRHKEFYAPEVVDSRLVARSGDTFDIYLRVRKKKIITVVLETDHHVEYRQVTASRWCCWSHTTRVAEVKDAGKSAERVGEPDTGYGFLWRLATLWRFEQHDDGAWIECRAISLTRDVPKALAWVIEPIVKKLPRESLVATLEGTRREYLKAAAERARTVA